MVALQRVLQRRHERLPVAGHGRYAAAVDVDVLEDEDLRHPAREGRCPAREVPLVRRFRRVALEERDGPAVGEELELQDIRMRFEAVASAGFARGADSSAGIVWSVAIVFVPVSKSRWFLFVLVDVVELYAISAALQRVFSGVEGSGIGFAQ